LFVDTVYVLLNVYVNMGIKLMTQLRIAFKIRDTYSMLHHLSRQSFYLYSLHMKTINLNSLS
jgi:hypothetical protein